MFPGFELDLHSKYFRMDNYKHPSIEIHPKSECDEFQIGDKHS
jgi:hypothetical protein